MAQQRRLLVGSTAPQDVHPYAPQVRVYKLPKFWDVLNFSLEMKHYHSNAVLLRGYQVPLDLRLIFHEHDRKHCHCIQNIF